MGGSGTRSRPAWTKHRENDGRAPVGRDGNPLFSTASPAGQPAARARNQRRALSTVWWSTARRLAVALTRMRRSCVAATFAAMKIT